MAIPSTSDMNTKAVSRVSLSTFRKRMIASAPIRPKAAMTSLPITNITRAAMMTSITRAWVKARE